jgi:Arc/MetJ family transcription regulator
MKKRSLVLEERLLEEAVEAIGARTKKEAVEAGLMALIGMKQKEMLRKDLGTVDMDLSLSELEELEDINQEVLQVSGLLGLAAHAFYCTSLIFCGFLTLKTKHDFSPFALYGWFCGAMLLTFCLNLAPL